MWRRKISVVVMALLMVVTNISFSFSGMAVSGKVTITIGMLGDDLGIAAAIEKVIPSVHVEIADLSDKNGKGQMELYSELDKAGKTPDIIICGGNNLNQLIMDGALVNITPLLARGKYIKSNDMAPIQAVLRMQPGSWRQGMGPQWGWVVQGEPCGFSLCINKALFNKAGIAIPSTKEPITYRELLDYAKRLTIQKDGRTIQWGFGLPFDDIPIEMLLSQMLGTTGKSLYSKDFLKVNMGSQEAKDALRFLYDLQRAGATPSILQPEGQIVQRFLEGKCGIMVTPYSMKAVGAPKPISDQFLTLPAARLGSKWYDPVGSSTTVTGISKKTKNLKLAWQVYDWVCWFYSKEVAKYGCFTGMKSTIPASLASLARLDPQRLEVLKESMTHSGLLQHNPYLNTSTFDTYCYGYLSQAVGDHIPFDEMIDKIEKDVNNEIMKGRAAYLKQQKTK